MSQFNNVGKIEDRVYMTVHHTDPKVFDKLGGEYKIFSDDIIEIENRFPLDSETINLSDEKINKIEENTFENYDKLKKLNLSNNFKAW
jgi:hypothetical protein